MYWKYLICEKFIGWGWVSIIMCLPFFIVHWTFRFDWDWMTGYPFIIFYTWALLSGLLVPIFILLQCWVIIRDGIKKKNISLQQVILLLGSMVLFVLGTPGLWK